MAGERKLISHLQSLEDAVAHLQKWSAQSEREFKAALLDGSACFPQYAPVYGQINSCFKQLRKRAFATVGLPEYRREVRAALERVQALPGFADSMRCCSDGEHALSRCTREICRRNAELLRKIPPAHSLSDPRISKLRALRNRLECLIGFVLEVYRCPSAQRGGSAATAARVPPRARSRIKQRYMVSARSKKKRAAKSRRRRTTAQSMKKGGRG